LVSIIVTKIFLTFPISHNNIMKNDMISMVNMTHVSILSCEMEEVLKSKEAWCENYWIENLRENLNIEQKISISRVWRCLNMPIRTKNYSTGH